MIDILQREFVYLWYYFSVQFEQIFRYWILGVLIGSAVSVFAKEYIHNAFRSLQNTKINLLGIVLASALGILSPLCMYGTIPISASFSKSGIKDDWLAAYMMSSILLNPQLIVYSAVLGNQIMVIRILTSFLCGAVAGFLVKLFYKDHSFFNFKNFDEPISKDIDKNIGIRYLKNVFRNIKVTGTYFLIGIILSALFQRYVPTEFMTALFGNNEAFGILMAATVGVPLYACGGGTIPLLQQWLYEGMSIGSATSFMITGPATKITNLGALKIILGIKNFVIYIIYIMLFSLIAGMFVNTFFKVNIIYNINCR